MPSGSQIEFRDALIARVENYTDIDAARRAAGLSGTWFAHDDLDGASS